MGSADKPRRRLSVPVEEKSYNVHMFILGSMFLAVSAWALYDETFSRRPWKQHQNTFFKLRLDKLERDRLGLIEELESPVGQRKLKGLDAQIAAFEAGLKTPDMVKRVAALRENVVKAKARLKEAEQQKSFIKSESDAEYYTHYLATLERFKLHEEGAWARDAKNAAGLAEIEKHVAEAKKNQEASRKKLSDFDARVAKQERVIAGEERALREAKLALTAVDGPIDALKEKKKELLNDINDVDRRIKNAKETSGTAIVQVVNPKRHLVDRCQSCHMAVDSCGYSSAAEIARTFEARETALKDAAKRVEDAEDEKAAKKFLRTERAKLVAELATKFCILKKDLLQWLAAREFASLKKAGVKEANAAQRIAAELAEAPEGALAMTSRVAMWVQRDEGAARKAIQPIEIPKVLETHPRRRELLGKHPVEKFGCTPCHGGQGIATGEKAGHGWAGYWEAPMQKGAFAESGCRKCHEGVQEVSGAAKLNAGMAEFKRIGCIGCHNTGLFDALEKVGPTLLSAGTKLDAGWIYAWLKNPQEYRPGTRMPQFFLSDEQARQITAFLVQQRAKVPTPDEAAKTNMSEWLGPGKGFEAKARSTTPAPAPATAPAPASALDDRKKSGLALIKSVGCLGCHGIVEGRGFVGSAFAPELTRVGNKVAATEAAKNHLASWILNPRAHNATTAMPSFRLTKDEAGDIVEFLLSTRAKSAPVPTFQKGDVEAGFALVKNFGCFGCHDIAGTEKESKIGIELNEIGSKIEEQLDFGYLEEAWREKDKVTKQNRRSWHDWVRGKLNSPRQYETQRIRLRMPLFTFDVDAKEAAVKPGARAPKRGAERVENLMVFLRSLRGDERHGEEFVKKLTDEQQAVERGRDRVRAHNCQGCHVIEQKGGDILAEYSDKSYGPPVLNGEGAKVRSEWLFGFLKQPWKLRPWLDLRMPMFGFTDDQATSLAWYFAATNKASYPFKQYEQSELSAEERPKAKALFVALGCPACHVDEPVRAPSLTLGPARLRPDWLIPWLHAPLKVQAGVNMPRAGWEKTPGPWQGDTAKRVRMIRDLLVTWDGLAGQADGRPGVKEGQK